MACSFNLVIQIEIEVTIPGYGFQHEYYQTPQFPTEYSVGVQYPFLKFKRKDI